MRYVALLRGINVGGASKISMSELRGVFGDAGMSSVRTYINSGNVLFSSAAQDRLQLTRVLEDAIHERCGVNTDVQLRNVDEMTAVVSAIPEHWVNDATMKCDVVFLQRCRLRSRRDHLASGPRKRDQKQADENGRHSPLQPRHRSQLQHHAQAARTTATVIARPLRGPLQWLGFLGGSLHWLR